MRTSNPQQRDLQGYQQVHRQNGHREVYRLQTFQQFPKNVPVHPITLASSGFFYSGYKDRVICFSCLVEVEHWVCDDNFQSEKWHKSSCKFIKGLESKNDPILKLSRSQQQTASSDEPFCQYLSPTTPRMENKDTRLNTFVWNWYLHASCPPGRVAAAGFHYTGVKDHVKCWYCNGGLCKWEAGVDPWLKHAKWFPRCGFLLRCKGRKYVQCVVNQFPNLHRPNLRSPLNGAPIRSKPASPRVADPVLVAPNHQPQLVTPIVERRQGRLEAGDPSGSEFVENAVDAGQDPKLAVEKTREQRDEMHGHREQYRLSTFREIAADLPISAVRLAGDGLLCLSNQQIECFSCGFRVDNWKVDVAQLQRCHTATCRFRDGEECRNVPLVSSLLQQVPSIPRTNCPPPQDKKFLHLRQNREKVEKTNE